MDAPSRAENRGGKTARFPATRIRLCARNAIEPGTAGPGSTKEAQPDETRRDLPDKLSAFNAARRSRLFEWLPRRVLCVAPTSDCRLTAPANARRERKSLSVMTVGRKAPPQVLSFLLTPRATGIILVVDAPGSDEFGGRAVATG